MNTQTNERKIEIVGQFKHIQVRDAVSIFEDGEFLATKPPHRFVIGPTDSTDDPELQGLKALYHTPELVAEYESLHH